MQLHRVRCKEDERTRVDECYVDVQLNVEGGNEDDAVRSEQ